MVMDSSDLLFDLPDEIANTLLCSTCEAYISCGPVKELNGKFICGRCDEADPNAVSQLCYERMMSNFTFPCRYDKEGCTDRLRFNSSLEHEQKCQYRPVVCPSVLKKACTLPIPANQLYSHFVDVHKDLISNDGQFKINLDEKVRYNALMIYDNNTIVVKYLYDDVERRLHLEVSYVSSDEDSLYYQLQLINGTNYDNSLSLSQQVCTLYETHTINSTNCAVIDMEKYLVVLENPPSLILKILLTSLVGYSTRSGSEKPSLKLNAVGDSSNEKEVKSDPSEAFVNLENFLCHACKSITSAPLYHPTEDNSLQFCESCREDHMIQSYDVVDGNGSYPCRWRGCTFLGDINSVFDHIKTCTFKKYVCPFYTSCEKMSFRYNQFEAFIKHLKLHSTYCPNPESITIQLFDKNSSPSDYIEKSYFTGVASEAIVFKCTIEPHTCNWTLRCVLPDKIEATVFFRHDHCRFISKVFSYDTQRLVDLSKGDIDFPLCFKEYPCLTAVVSLRNAE